MYMYTHALLHMHAHAENVYTEPVVVEWRMHD